MRSCSKNYEQTSIYTYNKGCGWCDYYDKCQSNQYCQYCCHNGGDTMNYNNCRLKYSWGELAERTLQKSKKE